MKSCNAPRNQTTRRVLLIACAMALAVAFAISLPQPAHADRVRPPDVPNSIKVPAGNKVFLKGHAVGTQNYICLPSSPPNPPFAWTLFGPQATLFDDDDKQIITHFLSPNPDEDGTLRATWQDSKDTSAVWALMVASFPVGADDIPWFLLRVVGAEEGPTGGDKLTRTTFIHRLNTSEGVAPSTPCTQLSDVGQRAFVPYTADYFFYKARNTDADDDD
jgi:Protein of unknown function (DUF3455)